LQEGDQDGYAKVFSYVARDILTDASTQYDAFSFFKNRTDIGDYMWRKLRKEFADNYFADVVFFQVSQYCSTLMCTIPNTLTDAMRGGDMMYIR
jgi:hypothetical protein